MGTCLKFDTLEVWELMTFANNLLKVLNSEVNIDLKIDHIGYSIKTSTGMFSIGWEKTLWLVIWDTRQLHVKFKTVKDSWEE